MISKQENGDVQVTSFTLDDKVYDIIIDQETNDMVSCTCMDQQSSNASCKHMYLVFETRSEIRQH